MNGLTRNAAYLAAAILAGLVATLFIWPEIWDTPRTGPPHWLHDPLVGAAFASVGLLYLRLLYVAATSRGEERRLALIACIAIAFLGFVTFIGSVVILTTNGAGAA